MKSIMEEASSIAKAIEKAWTSAGQPKEFTVKVFEEPQKNFIGLTTKPAKVGIFFAAGSTAKEAKGQAPRGKKGEVRGQVSSDERAYKKGEIAPQKQQRKTQEDRRFDERKLDDRKSGDRTGNKPLRAERTHVEPSAGFEKSRLPRDLVSRDIDRQVEQLAEIGESEQRTGPIWSDDIVAVAQEWITHILQLMDLGHVPFTVKPEHFHLRITFERSLIDDKTREKYLFSSLSALILTMLKRYFKRPLKGYKIVFIGG